MHRCTLRRLFAACFILSVAGCGRAPTVTTKVAAPNQSPATPTAEQPSEFVEYPQATVERTAQQRLESAVAAAMILYREDRLSEAYRALQQARAIQDAPIIQAAIESIESRVESLQFADRAAEVVAGYIQDGRPDLAAPLAVATMRAFGGGPLGPRIAMLKRQIDAMQTAALDTAGRTARFQKEVEESLAQNALRSGVVALEQSAFLPTDHRLRRAYEELRSRLRRYDEAIYRADRLRREPARYDEAKAAAKEAVGYWETVEARRMLGEFALADRTAQDRIAILDFDVRGDLGSISVARSVARDVTAAMQGRFDVIDRTELTQECQELGLTLDEAFADDSAWREVAQRAKLRYLVTGQVKSSNGVSVQGRFWEVNSGLVLQTAEIQGPSPQAVERVIPQFVAMLLMTDEQRWAYEHQLAKSGPAVPVVEPMAEIPPAPDPAVAKPPAPIVAVSMRHPEIGAGAVGAINSIWSGKAPSMAPAADHPLRAKVCSLATELGDNLLRRGLFNEAHTQYQNAFGISPNPLELNSRIDHCRPHVLSASDANVPPRVVVAQFAVSDGFGPPEIQTGLTDIVSAYLSRSLSVVSRCEWNWYMERLGLSLADLATDPNARYYLARALDVRYMVLGSAQKTATGFEVKTVLLQPESGAKLDAARVHSGTLNEMRFRLDELARDMQQGAGGNAKSPEAEDQVTQLLGEARKHAYFKNFAVSVELALQAQTLAPSSVFVRHHVESFQRLANQSKSVADSEAEEIRRQTAFHADRVFRSELQKIMEQVQAAAASQPASESDRRRLRDRAAGQLITQARTARSNGEYEIADQLLAAGIGLDPRPELEKELAQVRSQAVSQIRGQVSREFAAREQARRQQLEAEIIAARRRIEANRQADKANQQAWTKKLEEIDRRESLRLIESAKSEQANGETRLWLLQSARRLSQQGDVDRLLGTARLTQARAIAKQTSDAAAAEFESRLATESAARTKLDSESRRNQNFYAESMKTGDQALQFGQFDRAAKQYQEARKRVQSDAVLRGLRAAQDAQSRANDAGATGGASTDRMTVADFNKLLEAGRAAFDARKFDEAMTAFRKARVASPSHADVQAWIARTEKAQLDQLAAERRGSTDRPIEVSKPPIPVPTTPATAMATPATTSNPKGEEAPIVETKPKPKVDPAARLRDDFNKLVDQGRTAISFRRFGDAELSLDTALRLIPNDPVAVQLLAQAKSKVGPPEEFVQHLQTAAAHEKKELYGDAVKAYREAIRIAPDNHFALRRMDYVQRMDSGFRALRAKDYHQAAMEFESALSTIPDDPAALRALKQAKKP